MIELGHVVYYYYYVPHFLLFPSPNTLFLPRSFFSLRSLITHCIVFFSQDPLSHQEIQSLFVLCLSPPRSSLSHQETQSLIVFSLFPKILFLTKKPHYSLPSFFLFPKILLLTLLSAYDLLFVSSIMENQG